MNLTTIDNVTELAFGRAAAHAAAHHTKRSGGQHLVVQDHYQESDHVYAIAMLWRDRAGSRGYEAGILWRFIAKPVLGPSMINYMLPDEMSPAIGSLDWISIQYRHNHPLDPPESMPTDADILHFVRTALLNALTNHVGLAERPLHGGKHTKYTVTWHDTDDNVHVATEWCSNEPALAWY